MRSIHQKCSLIKVIKKIRKTHRKTPVLDLFLIKLQDGRLQLFEKRDSSANFFQ